MCTVRNQFLELLRCGLWSRSVDVAMFSGRTDWDAILTLASQQTVSGIIAEAIKTLPSQIQPPTAILNKFRSIVVANLRIHSLINRTLVEAVTLFTENGIPPILLKGQGVAMNYPNPTLRMCGDIDLYVGSELYDRACELAALWGDKDGRCIKSTKHYHFKHGNVVVELHRIAETLPSPSHNSRFQQWTQLHLHGGNLRSVLIEGAAISLPPVQFDALYIFNHLWHHFFIGGVGLRQLCDWVRYLHAFNKEIDQVLLERDLKSFGLWKAWRMLGCLAVDMLGLPEAEYPFYTPDYRGNSRRILDLIESEGNFGRYCNADGKRPKGYFAGKIHKFRRMQRRFWRLIVICPEQALFFWSRFIYSGIRQVVFEKLRPRSILN